MRRRSSFALIAGLIVVLLVSVVTQLWAFPAEVQRIATTFPEVEPLVVPGVIWGVIAIACWQAIAVIGLRLVVLSRDHRLNASDYGWLWAIIGCLLAFLVLVVSAFLALSVMGYSTPAMLALIGVGLVTLIAAGWLGLFLWTRPLARQYWNAQGRRVHPRDLKPGTH
jgi:drug/metabolite transporter (DMT)-like permease